MRTQPRVEANLSSRSRRSGSDAVRRASSSTVMVPVSWSGTPASHSATRTRWSRMPKSPSRIWMGGGPVAACNRPIAARSRFVATVAAPGGRNGTPSTSAGVGPAPLSSMSGSYSGQRMAAACGADSGASSRRDANGRSPPQRACGARAQCVVSWACGAERSSVADRSGMGEARPQRACERGHSASCPGRAERSGAAWPIVQGWAKPARSELASEGTVRRVLGVRSGAEQRGRSFRDGRSPPAASLRARAQRVASPRRIHQVDDLG